MKLGVGVNVNIGLMDIGEKFEDYALTVDINTPGKLCVRIW